MIKKNIKKNKGPASRRQANVSQGGFVLLFVVMLSSIILAITLGVADISLKEINFSTSAKNTNEAFFAADTGAECALFNDKSTDNYFINGGTGPIQCLGRSISLVGNYPVQSFIVSGLGSEGRGCAKVTVDKSIPPGVFIVSKGYNDGGNDVDLCIQGPNSIERQIELSY